MIHQGTLADIVTAAECIVKIACRLDPSRSGGYLTVCETDKEIPLAVIMIGNPPVDKRGKYFRLSQEKVERLRKNPAHESSAQTRDIAKEQFDGGIRVGMHRLGFSGLEGADDEAVVCHIGKTCLRLTDRELNEILKVSKNERYPTLIRAMMV